MTRRNVECATWAIAAIGWAVASIDPSRLAGTAACLLLSLVSIKGAMLAWWGLREVVVADRKEREP